MFKIGDYVIHINGWKIGLVIDYDYYQCRVLWQDGRREYIYHHNLLPLTVF